jgi:hypothetical protein
MKLFIFILFFLLKPLKFPIDDSVECFFKILVVLFRHLDIKESLQNKKKKMGKFI